ncbi:hypothetical protein AY600_13235 [Phormidium willei BDU 130791]|nr:hypothetical protein AY600_13235 [Phormidium willei BDU 130791]
MAAAIALVLAIALATPLRASDEVDVEQIRLDEIPYQVHPLPESLDAIAAEEHYGDQLEETPIGALVWSQFPVTVYLDENAPETWQSQMRFVVEQWGDYLPLQQIEASERADIVVWQRRPPPRRVGDDFRAAAARVSYQLDWREHQLSHRFEILLSPTQGTEAAMAALRHELGHALGIWGHSDRPTDVMYYSQVRRPPRISPRDLGTLRYVYEQPTRLGWPVRPDSGG